MFNTSRFARTKSVLCILCALALPGCGLADGSCSSTTPAVRLSATYRPSNGSAPFLSATLLEGDALKSSNWPAAIADATRVPPSTGLVSLKDGSGNSLTIGLPFPLQNGATIPISPPPLPPMNTAFTGDVATTEAGARYDYDCTGVAPNACLAIRSEIWQGTIQVLAVSPLQIKIDAQASYADLRSPDAIAGTIDFEKSNIEICQE